MYFSHKELYIDDRKSSRTTEISINVLPAFFIVAVDTLVLCDEATGIDIEDEDGRAVEEIFAGFFVIHCSMVLDWIFC